MSRLLRLIFVLLLALPGVQARACDPAPVAAQHIGHEIMGHGQLQGHEAPHPAPPIHHDCIGCIAPIDIRLYRPAETPQPRMAREPRPANIAFVLIRGSAPEPPPPRATV